eukprot:2066885-Amphidinium_carterae.1
MLDPQKKGPLRWSLGWRSLLSGPPDFVLRRQADVRHCSLGLRLEDSDNPPFQVDWGQSLGVVHTHSPGHAD